MTGRRAGRLQSRQRGVVMRTINTDMKPMGLQAEIFGNRIAQNTDSRAQRSPERTPSDLLPAHRLA